MKITGVKTFLMSPPLKPSLAEKSGSTWNARNWLFVKVYTDEGIFGIGEGSGWPRVIETAVQDIAPILIGEDPMNIERIWQKILTATMGNGMTGTVGSGAMNGIDMALWDIKGKALNTPVWNLLGGKVRDRIRVYGHASTPEGALELKAKGITGVKTGGVIDPVDKVEAIRNAVGDEMDIMVDAHGPPWFTTKDAILVGKALEPYNLLFYEDPVPPDNMDALARVQDNVDIPIAAGERHSHIWGVRELIERELVDVVQPDSGRIGGITQLKKIAAMAEAHYITVCAPFRFARTGGRVRRPARAGSHPKRPDSRTAGVRFTRAVRGDRSASGDSGRLRRGARQTRAGCGHRRRSGGTLPEPGQHRIARRRYGWIELGTGHLERVRVLPGTISPAKDHAPYQAFVVRAPTPLHPDRSNTWLASQTLPPRWQELFTRRTNGVN